MMYDVSIDNLLNNNIVNIIDNIPYLFVLLSLTFYRKQSAVTQTVSSFSSTTHIHNFEIICHMIRAVL